MVSRSPGVASAPAAHHCMRLIGPAQRCLELMCRRVDSRGAFGNKLADQGVIRQEVAKDIIAMIKIVAPRMCQEVADRAMLAHGGMGLCQGTPIAKLFSYARFVRLADGPDEVHMALLGQSTCVKATAPATSKVQPTGFHPRSTAASRCKG